MKSLVQSSLLWTSFILSAILLTLIYYFNGNPCVSFPADGQTTPYEIAKLISGIAGTVFGFLLAAIAMLTAVMDKKLVINMKKTGHYQVFIRDSLINCAFLLVTMVSGISLLFTTEPTLTYVFGLMLYAGFASIIYLIELGRRFSLIFSII